MCPYLKAPKHVVTVVQTRRPATHWKHQNCELWYVETSSYLEFPFSLKHVARLCRTIQSQFAILVLPSLFLPIKSTILAYIHRQRLDGLDLFHNASVGKSQLSIKMYYPRSSMVWSNINLWTTSVVFSPRCMDTIYILPLNIFIEQNLRQQPISSKSPVLLRTENNQI